MQILIEVDLYAKMAVMCTSVFETVSDEYLSDEDKVFILRTAINGYMQDAEFNKRITKIVEGR